MDWHVRYKAIKLDEDTFTAATVTVEFYNKTTEDKFEEEYNMDEGTNIAGLIDSIFARLKVINDFNDKILFIRTALGKDVERERAVSLGIRMGEPVFK